jgi:hypothetical protein
VGKFLLYSSGVTLPPLLVKERATFNPLDIHISLTVPLQKLATAISNVQKSLLYTTRSN